jgi:hypothetical protein
LIQEISPVQLGHLCHPTHTREARLLVTVPVSFADFGERRECRDVQPMITIGVELERLAADQQKRRGDLSVIADHLAHTGEGFPEVLAGLLLRLFGPEQPGQGIPAVGTIRLNGQIGQQCPHLVGGKVSDRLTIQGDLQRPQQKDG